MFPLWLRHFPWCGDWTSASVQTPAKGRSSLTNTPVSPPSSFILLSFVWFYIFFSGGQVFLSTLRWCSTSTFVSEGVFLMFPWRKMYSMSTYYFTILYSKQVFFNFMAAVIFYRNYEAQKRKICHCFHISLFCLPWSDGTRGHDLCIFNDES